ncbi:MAG: VCBS repeat-containing protein, partial [Phycisphaerales bacterium]
FCPDSGTVYSTTDQTEGDAPIAVRACDIDNDGDPDLITANDGSHTVSVLLNNGNGTYAAPLRWTTTTTPFDPICCEEPVDP